MIKSDAFYQAFEAGLARAERPAALQRSRGKVPKYRLDIPGDSLSLWFKVNGKASAIPYQPGEFWPVLEARTMRHGPRDDGLVSWYQYTDEAMEGAIMAQQRGVFEKTRDQAHFEPEFWRQARDVWLAVNRGFLDFELRPGFPHTRLYYLDEADALQWGVVFGAQLGAWIERFTAKPETLEAYMWREVWSQDGQGSTREAAAPART